MKWLLTITVSFSLCSKYIFEIVLGNTAEIVVFYIALSIYLFFHLFKKKKNLKLIQDKIS